MRGYVGAITAAVAATSENMAPSLIRSIVLVALVLSISERPLADSAFPPVPSAAPVISARSSGPVKLSIVSGLGLLEPQAGAPAGWQGTAFAAFERAVEKAEYGSKTAVAACKLFGVGTTADPEAALRMFRMAAADRRDSALAAAEATRRKAVQEPASAPAWPEASRRSDGEQDLKRHQQTWIPL